MKMCSYGTQQSIMVIVAWRVIDLLHTDAVLDEPFVDCFCRMGHKDTTSKVGFRQDERQTHRVVKVETALVERSACMEVYRK